MDLNNVMKPPTIILEIISHVSSIHPKPRDPLSYNLPPLSNTNLQTIEGCGQHQKSSRDTGHVEKFLFRLYAPLWKDNTPEHERVEGYVDTYV